MRRGILHNVETDPQFAEGIERFNQRDFYAAHDAWESLWLETAPGEEKEFLQGLILAAVALHHYGNSNHRGARSRFRLACDRLEAVPSPFWGVDVKKFVRRMKGALHGLMTSDHPAPLNLKVVPSLRRSENGKGDKDLR